MPSDELRIESTRGPLVESVHRVAVAIVDASGTLLAASGDPEMPTWWRSAAKPFQSLPLLQDGAAERFQLTDQELALACASHSSEPRHLEVVAELMARVGISDHDLSCGVHPPLSPVVAQAVIRGESVPTRRWSNCSGKHAGMLACSRSTGAPPCASDSRSAPWRPRTLGWVLPALPPHADCSGP